MAKLLPSYLLAPEQAPANLGMRIGRLMPTKGWLQTVSEHLVLTRRDWTVCLGLMLLILTSRLSGYVFFHIVVETLAMFAAVLVAAIGWHNQSAPYRRVMQWLGFGYFWVALCDFFHMVTYKDMNVIVVDGGNIATQVWLVARIVESVTLLGTPLVATGIFPTRHACWVVGVAVLSCGALIAAGYFPTAYVDGTGVTSFKVLVEYAVVGILLGAIYSIARSQAVLPPALWGGLLVSAAMTIGAEICFTLYSDVFDWLNLYGHAFKVLSCLVLLFTLTHLSIRRPFLDLQQEVERRVETETQLKRTVLALERSKDELERFAYMASHDLQEPLRSIVSFSELLDRKTQGTLDADSQGYLNEVVSAGRRMKRLIHDLLSYTRLSQQDTAREPVGLDAVLAEARKNLAASISSHRATISVRGSMPVVRGNRAQLTVLFQNLIGNALKYARPGVPPQIGIDLRRKGSQIELAVADNGRGIDGRFLDAAFHAFRRLHSDVEVEGSGIGLAVCKSIVENHGGKIWLESEVGTGTTAFVVLALPSDQSVEHDEPVSGGPTR